MTTAIEIETEIVEVTAVETDVEVKVPGFRFVCDRGELFEALALTGKAVSSRPSHPVLANMLVEAAEDMLILSGFDLSLGIEVSMKAEVLAEGKITLPSKLLVDIVSRLPDGNISFDQLGDMVTITTLSGSFEIQGLDADEFPALPECDGESLILDADAFTSVISKTLYATSTDETKQVLTGVHLTLRPGEIEAAATDGHRLAVCAATAEGEVKEQSEVTVPAKAIGELVKLLKKFKPDSIRLTFDMGRAIFEFDNAKLTSRLLEGQYPNYGQLIPKQFSRVITLDRRLLTSALDRVSVIADQKNNIIKFTIDSETQEVVLSVDAAGVGKSRQSIPAQIQGEDIVAAFNVKYLMDALRCCDTAEVQIQINTPTNPAIVTPLGGDRQVGLIMPVQIRS